MDSAFVPVARTGISGWVGSPTDYNFKIDHNKNVIIHDCYHYTSSGYGNTIMKLNTNLQFMWTSNYLAYPMHQINSAIDFDIDPQNNIYFTGFSYQYYSGTSDRSYIGKLHPLGMLTWLMEDTLKSAVPQGIKVLANNQFYLAGSYSDSTHLGPFNFNGTGEFFAFYGLTPLEIKESFTNSSFNIFPNPSSGIFTVTIKDKTGDAKICVYDVLGSCVLDEMDMKSSNQEIDLRSQPKGIYFMEIVFDGVKVVKKIVLQ